MANYFLAIDIGASCGRHILGTLVDGKIEFEEVYRFQNGIREINGHLCWDADYLLEQLVTGMKRCKELHKIPISVGIDTWGVDFILLDQDGNQLGDFVSYRDHRTDDMKERVEQLISKEAYYERTGIQSQGYNTIYQLMSLKETTPNLLQQADCMLMTPDYFNYRLTGLKQQEYTMATTTQLLNVDTNDWDYELIQMLGLPKEIFLPIKRPGTILGTLSTEMIERIGYNCQVVMSASHDTASAIVSIPCLDEKALYISSGTWSLMGVELKDALCSLESMNTGFTNEGGYDYKNTYLKNIMGLWMIQSVQKEIGQEKSFGEICEMASKESIPSVVDCNHDMFLSPDSMVKAIQTYCQNTSQQVPESLAEVAAVIYHSLARCYAETKIEIEQLLQTEFDRIYIIGGGSQANYLNQLTSKYANSEICAGPVEATAIGNILIQMIEQQELSNLKAARSAVMNSFEPTMIHCKA